MGSFWDGIRDQAESLGGVIAAPAGVLYDLASVPFNDEDDSIGTVAARLAERAAQGIDPIINPDTASGAVVGGVMDAANTALREGVSEPISTFFTLTQHATNQDTVADRIGTIFSGEDWGRAYEIAQNTNAGQALATQVLDGNLTGKFEHDPFDYEDPYEEVTSKEHSILAPTVSWGANIAGAFALDPFALAGKGLGAASQAHKYGKLSQGQRAELGSLLTETGARRADRVSKWADWTAGQNQMGRPLTAPEILQASPELRKWAADPHVIAGLVADANKLADPVDRRNAVRRIIAVAGGDATQLSRLRAEITDLPHIADALKNMRRGNVLDLKKIASDPTIAQNPQFIQHLEGQITRLNTDGAIDKMMDSWSARLDQLAGTAQTLNHLPGVHHSGRRALNRVNDQGIARAPKNLHNALEGKALAKVDEWSAKRMARAEGAGMIFQKGLATVPILAIKTAGMAASPYTRLLPNVNDAMRQTQFTGVAKLDSWGDATSQLDSMLKISHVAPNVRMELLSKAYLAKNEPEKLRLIHEAERVSMRSMAQHYSARAGNDIDSDYIEELMVTHAAKRGATLQHLYGRSYAATAMPDDMAARTLDRAAATRAKGMGATEDAATKAASRDSFTPQADDAKWQLRVDHVADEDGMPIALPLLSSQLSNAVPLIDMGLAKKLLKQDTSFLSRTSKAWRTQKDELDELLDKQRTGKIKGSAAVGLEKSIEAKRAAMDWMMLAGQKSLRVWKMSVLLRLGYPARVVLDDHWRIWSQIGAGTFYGSNIPEATKNLGFNAPVVGGRAKLGRQEYRRAKLEAEGLRDELRSDRMTSYPARLAEHKKAQRSAAAHRGQITKLRAQMDETDRGFEETAEELFHGTDQDFKTFGSHGRRGRHGTLGASYFTEDPAIAKKFGEDRAYGYLDLEGPELREFSLHGDATDADLHEFLREKGVAKGLERQADDDTWQKIGVEEVTIADALEGRVRRLVKPKARTIKAKVYGKTLDLRHPKVNGFYTHPEQMRAWMDEQPEVVRAWVEEGSGPVARSLRNSLERRGDAVNWREHDGDAELLEFARENGFGKIRVYDADNAGGHSVMALDDMIAHNREVKSPARAKIEERIAHHEKMIAEADAQALYLQEQMGEVGPEIIQKQLDVLHEVLKDGPKGLRPEKRHIGLAPVDIGDGYTAPGAFSGVGGGISRVNSSSRETFEYQQKGVEDSVYGRAKNGAHRTVANDEPGHLAAWADVLNNQIRNSPEAMHFVKGGTVEDFVTWVKAPEQAELRRRLPHYAHDPEEWGERIESLVHDYIPNKELAERVLGPGVTQKWLAKNYPESLARPHVHGMVAADTVGTSDRALGIGRQINRVFSFLADKPTDHLSRHPYFNAMYKMHVKDMAETRRLSYAKTGQKFGQSDIDEIANQARRLALSDVKRTLFDISAHSHAAHAMRFVSPFFAAHQEVLSRWWRIVGENPGVVRRFQQAFDAPRHAGLVIDENGEKVEPGDAVSFEHSLLLPLPKAFGGNQKWSISENSFNLVLQGGLANPGAGPLVTVPLEYLSQKYAETEEIARVARIFNPFPPSSPGEAAMPATLKRALGVGYGMGFDPLGMNGIGMREYNDAYSRNIQDLTVDFQLKYGREPNKSETDTLMKRAGRETNVDMVLRLANNVGSPFPARPNSKYAAVQQGWWQIREQGRAKHPADTEAAYEWSYRQFKEKYGEAYMALTYSQSNNVAGLDGSPAEVAAYKRYKGIISTVDPHLTRAVMGAYLDKSGASQERTPEGKNFFVDTSTRPGSSEKFFSTDEPADAMEEQMARRGWQKYGELTGAITAQAQQMGLTSYTESDQLVALRKAGLAKLKEENWAFRADIDDFDAGQYDAYVDDMRKIVGTTSLYNDPEREDVRVLGAYLKLRDYFVSLIAQRQAAGLGGPDAAATQPILGIYTKLVGALVEQNTYFEENMYNGLVERDPLLIGSD